MSALGDVIESLKVMSLWQLLLAFSSCTAYGLAQGGLMSTRVRRIACVVAALGAFGFIVEADDWMSAAMLVAIAIAGLGMFTAMVWITSRLLGFDGRTPAETASLATSQPAAPAADSGRPRLNPPVASA